MNFNINEFAEQTASHNVELNYQATREESARQSHLMKVYGTEVKVLSNKEIRDEFAKAKKKQKEAADMAWLTPEYCKKKYKEIMEKSKAKEAEEKKSIQEALKSAPKDKEVIRAADQKVADVLAAKPEEKVTPVIHRGPERIPMSKAKVLSKKITQQQQTAFHQSFGAELGLNNKNQFLSRIAGKGKGVSM